MLEAKLLFGLTDEGAFANFLDTAVTPRFPAGLTVISADGRWRTPGGRMTQERSKLILILAEPGPETHARLQAIRSDYKTAFHQQSVGLVTSSVCADF